MNLVDTSEREADTQAARYQASFFGPFRITLNGNPLGEPTWRRNRARTLLKWFLINPSTSFSEEQLCAYFWPDRCRQKASNNLHVTLHYLRHVLEPGLPPRGLSTFVRRNANKHYWFDPQGLWWTDVSEVRDLLAAARLAKRRGDVAQAIRLYERCVSYYQLTFLPEELYEDVFSTHRFEHDTAHADSLNELMHLYLCAGQLPNALSCATQLLAIDPSCENAVKSIVHVYLRQGNVSGALRQLDDFLAGQARQGGATMGSELLTLRSNILLAR